jgi:hypothetical protein
LHLPRFFSIWRVNFNPLNPFDMPVEILVSSKDKDPRYDKIQTLEGLEALEHCGRNLLAYMLKELPLPVAECFIEDKGERLFFMEAGFVLEETKNPDPTKEGNVIEVSFDFLFESDCFACFEEPKAAADFCRALYLANYSTSY